MPRFAAIATFVSAAVLASTVSLSTSSCVHGEGLDEAKLPVNVRSDYEVFAQKCSKCHSLARPLTANITDYEQWVLYVNRMRRQPASGISPQDQEGILRFLKWYAADLRRIQAEKNGGGPPAPQAVPILTPPPDGALPAPVPAPAPTAASPAALSAADGGAK